MCQGHTSWLSPVAVTTYHALRLCWWRHGRTLMEGSLPGTLAYDAHQAADHGSMPSSDYEVKRADGVYVAMLCMPDTSVQFVEASGCRFSTSARALIREPSRPHRHLCLRPRLPLRQMHWHHKPHVARWCLAMPGRQALQS